MKSGARQRPGHPQKAGLRAVHRLTLILLAAALAIAISACQRGRSPRVATPAITSAQQWGSDPDPIPDGRRHVPDRITVHHAGVVWTERDDPATRLRNLQMWGKRERQWPDLPYHYLIAPDGGIFQGRPIRFQPETNTDYDTRGHLGVQLWGNFMEQRVSLEQLEATANLIAWLCDRHNIPPSTIMGHRDVASDTLCPGDDLHRYISDGDLRVWVAEIVAGRQPDIQLKDPIEDAGATDP